VHIHENEGLGEGLGLLWLLGAVICVMMGVGVCDGWWVQVCVVVKVGVMAGGCMCVWWLVGVSMCVWCWVHVCEVQGTCGCGVQRCTCDG
jgi:hypothetical protein